MTRKQRTGEAAGAEQAKPKPQAQPQGQVVSHTKEDILKYLKPTSAGDESNAGRHKIPFGLLKWDLKREFGQPRKLDQELWSGYYRKLLVDGPPRVPYAEGLAWQKSGMLIFQGAMYKHTPPQ